MPEQMSKASTGQAQDLGLLGKAGFRSGVKLNASKAQELHGTSGWETLILEEALTTMERMPQHPSLQNLTCVLHKCRTKKNMECTKRFFAYMCKHGLEDHISLGNYLVAMLVQVGCICDAQQVFDKLADRNVHSWTSLIRGYIECGDSEHALSLYQKMQEGFVHPSKYTFAAVLKACAKLKDTERGGEVHSEIARKGLERDLFVGSTLVDMYAKCGSLAEAQEAFDKLSVRDVVLWTALISGYTEQGLGEEALKCLGQMQLEGLSPDAATFVCSLKACGSIGAIDKGREIHEEISRKRLERNILVGSALVDMYVKCGSLAEAWEAFDKLLVRDTITWTALIAGFAEQGLGEEALNCLKEMQLEGLSPNAVTFVCSLKASGSIGAIDKGQEIHTEIARRGLERDLLVGNTLVDMYAQGGVLAEAQEAFDKMPVRNEVSWTALMAGYAQQGKSETVFCMLERMRREGIKPDGVTLSVVLTVCSHAGLVHKGQKYFGAMTKVYGISSTVDHHIGMVDLLSRAGQLDEAVAMVKKMPFQSNLMVWRAVLGGCRKWGNVEVGRLAFKHAVHLGKKDAGSYVLMSNIYADVHMQNETKEVQARCVKTSM